MKMNLSEEESMIVDKVFEIQLKALTHMFTYYPEEIKEKYRQMGAEVNIEIIYEIIAEDVERFTKAKKKPTEAFNILMAVDVSIMKHILLNEIQDNPAYKPEHVKSLWRKIFFIEGVIASNN